MKELWLDLETTGLEHESHKIVEIAMVYQNGEELKKFHTYIKYSTYPPEYMDENSRARVLTGLSPEFLEEHGVLENHAFQGVQWFFNNLVDSYTPTDKMILCGYNVDFDDNFMRQFFTKNGGRYYGSYITSCRLNVMNTLSLATKKGKVPILRSYKLQDVAKYFNIEFDAHKALDDIETTMKIQNHLEGLLAY